MREAIILGIDDERAIVVVPVLSQRCLCSILNVANRQGPLWY